MTPSLHIAKLFNHTKRQRQHKPHCRGKILPGQRIEVRLCRTLSFRLLWPKDDRKGHDTLCRMHFFASYIS
jgi:hypothetical protein